VNSSNPDLMRKLKFDRIRIHRCPVQYNNLPQCKYRATSEHMHILFGTLGTYYLLQEPVLVWNNCLPSSTPAGRGNLIA
jgi:hypothetical protein